MMLISIFDWLSLLSEMWDVVLQNLEGNDIGESSEAEKVTESESFYHLVTSLVKNLAKGGKRFVEK